MWGGSASTHSLGGAAGPGHWPRPRRPLEGGPPTTHTNLVRGVAGGTHPLARSPAAHSLPRTKLVRVVAEPASVRRRRALRAARRTTPLAAGRRHSLPRTKLVRIVSRPPTTTPGSTSPLDPPRRPTSPRPAHRLTCASVDLVPRRAWDHFTPTASLLFIARPGEASWCVERPGCPPEGRLASSFTYLDATLLCVSSPTGRLVG